METVYIQRNAGGNIVGVYANPQSFAQEAIDNQDTSVTTFLSSLSPPQPLSFQDFMALFTPSEQAVIVTSTDTNLKLWLLKATGTGHIALGDPETKQGLDYLTSLGIINATREAQILSNTPPA